MKRLVLEINIDLPDVENGDSLSLAILSRVRRHLEEFRDAVEEDVAPRWPDVVVTKNARQEEVSSL